MLSKLLELLGVACFFVFAYLLWPPATLVVLGVVLLFAGYALAGVSFSVRRKKAE